MPQGRACAGGGGDPAASATPPKDLTSDSPRYHGRREAFTNFPLAEYESEWAALEGMPLTDAIALVKRRAEEDRRSARKPATPPATAARPPQSPRTTALLGVAAQAFADSSFSNRSPQPVDVFSLRVPKRPRSGPVASRAASVESAEPSAGDVPAEKPLRVLRHCASAGARRQQDSPTSVFGLYPGSEDGSERGSAPDHKADGAADGAADGGLRTPGTATPTGSEAGGAGGA